MPKTETPLYIGTHVIYTGRFTQMHDRVLLVLPCMWDSRCEHCNEWDLITDDPEADREHFLAVDELTGDAVKHVARDELKVLPWHWPADAVEFNINGYWHAAAYTAPGGSSRARTVHFYTAGDHMWRTWCYFREVTPEVRRLDQQARRRPAF
ncbi:hypothetical protein AQJ46_47880 [Streptomyces canus]|uniref:Uncharacterized protein n=1 Tax=Streptomyces canus TaxID=58343 RepID=A0A101RKR7_9ACTN|nr:hypothetical protein [Streptomyces canus]KUN57281.1 hypothetical protein AQJ46_47880 [Streptomyces canus]